MKRSSFSLFVLLCVVSVVGCTQTASVREMFTQSFDSLKPNHHDYSEGSGDVNDGWVSEAGEEARGHRPLEKDPDPLRNILMSPKAKSIEKNLGIE